MEIVILEKDNKIAKSLKRCISPRYQCSIENDFDIKWLEKKYRGSSSIFLIDECIFDQSENEINREGLKLAHWIVDRLHLKAIVFGLEIKEKSPIPYWEAPFELDNLFEEIQKAVGVNISERYIENDLLLDKYETFRSKISHDYLQYASKRPIFYKFLLSNFYKYTNLIFGINLDEETNVGEGEFEKVIKIFEGQNDSSILHNVLRELKIENIEESQLKDWPGITKLFFKNLDVLIKALDTDEIPADVEERLAENFFMSWYLWRRLFFLEKYDHYFSDGFYKGCFRILLSHNRHYYQELKRDTLMKVFNTANISKTVEHIRDLTKELQLVFEYC